MLKNKLQQKNIHDIMIENIFKLGWSSAKYSPDKTSTRAFTLLADSLWKKQGKGVKQLERNIARVRPELNSEELKEITRQSLRSYMRYWKEAFQLPHWPKGHAKNVLNVENPENIDQALAQGKGVILVSTHSGNWDLAGAWLAERYGKVTTVAERLKPEGLYQQFVKHREAFGAEIFPTGTPNILDILSEKLNNGEVLALMGDRDISRKGVHVPLFNETASLPIGPSRLAVTTGAPLIPIDLWYEENGPAKAKVGSVINIPRNESEEKQVLLTIKQTAKVFEKALKTHTTDWHMMQPVWLADLQTAH